MEWICTKDSLPDINGENVLAWDGQNMFVAHRWSFKEMPEEIYFKSCICSCCNSEIGEGDQITHWMPLPAGPQLAPAAEDSSK